MAPNRPTLISRLFSTRTTRIALLLGLIAVAASVVSSTSLAGTISQKFFTAIAGGVQMAPETHALSHEEEAAAAPALSTTMLVERRGHTATRLADGRVLVAGGENSTGTLNETELYDPSSETFSAAANMATARADHSATLLADGRVLIAGGNNGGASVASTEIFDPATGAFTSGPTMSVARAGHSATLFANGRVLIAGGDTAGTAEIFDPAAETFTATGSMGAARSLHSAALLQDGRVLIVGGRDGSGNALLSGEIFDTGAFAGIANAPRVARVRAHLRVLFDGKVQIIGGNNDGSMELYDPAHAGFGGYAHVLPEGDPCAGLFGQIQNTQTRAALFHNGQADALFDRAGHTITELNGQALVLGGANSSGAVLSSSAVLASSGASISTDKIDYAPGETAHITGRGFQPGEVVRLKIHEDPHTPQERGLDVTADADGNFTGDYLVMDYDLDMKFIVGARGLTSGATAQTTMTDANNFSVTPASQTVAAGSVNTFVWTFTAQNAANVATTTFTIPAGWTAPQTAPGPGRITITAGTCAASLNNISGQVVTINQAAGGCNNNTTFTLTYSTATAPSPAVTTVYTFTNQHGNSPTVTVTTANINTTTTVANANATYGDTSVTLNATVTPASGPAVNNGSVTFTVKQGLTTIGAATTDNTVVAGAASVSYALPAGTDAGPYTIEASYTPGSGFNASSGTGTLTIGKRAIEVTADAGQFKTYGDADPASFTYTITSGALVPPDAFTGALSRVAGENAGLYAITIGTLAINDGNGGNNYNLTFVSKNFEIKKRAIEVTADSGQFKTYGDADPATFTYTITNGSLVSPDAFTGALSRVAGENAGLYAITIGTLAINDGNGGNNYNLTFVSKNFEIKKRAIEVTADSGQFKTYGDADPATFTYTITNGSLVSPDAFTGALSRVAGENAGLYAITIGTLAINDGNGGNNYNLTFVSKNFEIKKRAIEVTADSGQFKTYGDADPATFTYTITNGSLVSPDAFTGALSRVAGENAGLYAITIGTLAINDGNGGNNYNLTFVSKNFEIKKRAIEVTADSGQFKTYGEADPATFTYTITNGSLVSPDAFTGALSRVAGENAGLYAITIGTLAINDGNGGNNYNLTFVSKNFEIRKRPITVKADAKTKTFGDPDPVFTYQITSGSLAFTDTFTGALTRDPGELVGQYTIKIGTLAINDGNSGLNYTLTFVSDKLTILTACSVFNGFLSPIGGAVELGTGGTFADPVRAFKLNSTIPVKFTAICFGAPLTTGVHTLTAIKYSNATDGETPIDATPTDAATTGNQFRLTGTEWHFNMNTKALGGNATGTYLLKATLFDGSSYSVWVSIKK
ncbi:MAG TPA: MBG domain-containing protein [Pyrinomonadaceae bacterium]|nr:MBG domain-containing protein [Pyrinomonadaceae bacterium]